MPGVSVNITVDCDTNKITIVDSTDYASILGIGLDPGDPLPLPSQVFTVAKFEWGDGITVEYGSESQLFVAQSTDWKRVVDLRHTSLKLTYTAFESEYGNQVGLPQVFEFTLPETATVNITESFDLFAPLLKLVDSTTYMADGYDVSHNREWYLEEPRFNVFDDHIVVNPVTGEYDFVFKNTVSYTSGNITVTKIYSISGVFEIKRPIMLPEFIECLKKLFAKMNAMSCCDDAQYDIIKEDFQTAMGLFNLFVASGQVPVTADLGPIYDKIVSILRKWGLSCNIDDTDTTPISTYDFCLCPGGGGASREVYNAGNGVWIAASATGITFAKAAGVGTFSGVGSEEIFGATIQGTAGEASYDSNGATNSFKVLVPSKNANLAGASALIASCKVYDAANISGITDATPLVEVYDVPVHVVGIGSNTIEIAFIGIGATHSGGWAITFINP